jgi:hypothetical protein
MPKPLPIGVQTFRKIIEGSYLYVDKTRWIYDLIRNPSGVYFLARPRRFGKSLLISTLEEIFRGNRELFRGLWLYDQPYDWRPYPIVRIDFSLATIKSAEALEQHLQRLLHQIAEEHQATLADGPYYALFADLIRRMAKDGKVVILVDEYDKPLIDNLGNLAEAQQIREVLKGFYIVIKGMDAYVRFVLLTGVSKFSKVGVFSGLNNLEDLSMSGGFSAALGITEEELLTNCQEHLADFATQRGVSMSELLPEIRRWYDGFCFSADCQHVYNPFSLLLLLRQRRFSDFWFETGTPTFLLKLIRDRGYDVRTLDQLEIEELAFSSYELETLRVVPLLVQTGYLTIKGYDRESRLYRLGYPNYEVERAFLTYLLDLFRSVEDGLAGAYLWRLVQALRAADFDRFFEILAVFFSDIPYDLHIPQERYYQTIFYLIFRLLGLQVGVEVHTSRGRADAVIELAEGVFIFEFKVAGSAAEALTQIKTRGYAEPYRLRDKAIYQVGIGFDPAARGLADWQVEEWPIRTIR